MANPSWLDSALEAALADHTLTFEWRVFAEDNEIKLACHACESRGEGVVEGRYVAVLDDIDEAIPLCKRHAKELDNLCFSGTEGGIDWDNV